LRLPFAIQIVLAVGLTAGLAASAALSQDFQIELMSEDIEVRCPPAEDIEFDLAGGTLQFGRMNAEDRYSYTPSNDILDYWDFCDDCGRTIHAGQLLFMWPTELQNKVEIKCVYKRADSLDHDGPMTISDRRGDTLTLVGEFSSCSAFSPDFESETSIPSCPGVADCWMTCKRPKNASVLKKLKSR
jgi:hypothetical protein